MKFLSSLDGFYKLTDSTLFPHPSYLYFDEGELIITNLGLIFSLYSNDGILNISNLKYLAPETLIDPDEDGEIEIKKSNDIWMLGVILLEMCFKKFPIRNIHDLYAVKQKELKILFRNNGREYSDELIDFIAKCLNSNPTERATLPDLIVDPLVNGTVESSNRKANLGEEEEEEEEEGEEEEEKGEEEEEEEEEKGRRKRRKKKKRGRRKKRKY